MVTLDARVIEVFESCKYVRLVVRRKNDIVEWQDTKYMQLGSYN